MEIFFIVIISYLLGSIPFGYLLTKFFLKKDIRKIGSGNIGATNALRTGNKALGYFTLALDILKAVIPIFIIKIYFQEYVYISSLSVFLGHIFPVWLKFKGGKGVATALGLFLALTPTVAVVQIITWLAVALGFRYSSLAAIVTATMTPLYVWLVNRNGYFISLSVIIGILLILRHRKNIQRLTNKTEPKINLRS